ncbi:MULTISPECIES: hypothetical protein [Shewanella]|uniref:hypothetical protein n=1 Tax=Shewanella TaxID=22 RepID=UPI000903E9E8|nr:MULTISPECIES: hypothetical protein [Shewanella]AVT46310.1 hypothetical protein C8I07_00490 [Shewanella baltica]MCB2383451.1 hypothetical protein [Shewanella sp. SR1]MCS6099196.1 hypothetical protein [Shewanella baltica]MCS6117723.1 hypothetical protein [Shewanella baltica]MCS6182737.1 hypothetical protein [Shewanella baltica]
MLKNKDDEIVGFFPTKKWIAVFLVVTMLLTLATAISCITVFSMHLDVGPEWMVGILSFMAILFSMINFGVTRGSFVCWKVLEYYALLLSIISIPSLLMAKTADLLMFFSINSLMLFSAFYLIRSHSYQKLVQYQFDHFSDIKEAKEAVEEEMKRNRKRQKSHNTR